MTVPSFPSGLPPLLLADYQQSLPKNVMRSPMDVGPDKLRRRSTAAVAPLSGSLVINGDQLGDLIDFYNTDLGYGIAAFYLTDPLDPESNLLCRFVDPPQWNALGEGLHQVKLSLEVLP